MKTFILLLLIISPLFSPAQAPEERIQIRLMLDGQELVLGKHYFLPALGDSMHLDAVRFYLSDIQLFKDDDPLPALGQRHFLIDAEQAESQEISLGPASGKPFNNIRFVLGVDSLTQVSGAFGGDLDPSQGMYWTWQSGYIHVKLEGESPLCPARKNRFQFHLGGYQGEFNSLQHIELAFSKRKSLQLELDIYQFLDPINLQKTYQIMSPSAKAVALSQHFSTLFSVLP